MCDKKCYCSGCKKHIDKLCPKKLILLKNIKIKKNQDVLIVCVLNSFLTKYKTDMSQRLLCLSF